MPNIVSMQANCNIKQLYQKKFLDAKKKNNTSFHKLWKQGMKMLSREYEILSKSWKKVNTVMFEPLFWWDTIYKPQKYRKMGDNTNKTLT